MHFGPMQLILILVIVVLLFGTKKLRNVGGDLGEAFKNFKKAVKDDETTPSSEQAQAPSQVTQQTTGRVIDSEAKEKNNV